MESLEEQIVSELDNLYLTLGEFHDLSDTILQHALSSSDIKVKCLYITYSFIHYIYIGICLIILQTNKINKLLVQ